MNRESGGAALILLVLAMAFFRGERPPVAPVVPPVRPAAASGTDSGERVLPREPGIGARLLAGYLGAEAATPEALAPLWATHDLSVLVATVPDPMVSHLDWTFDALVDSLRRAHERMGYLLVGFEYPWDFAAKSSKVSRGMAGSPGALLFRKRGTIRTQLHLVYLVGEVSNAGLDLGAFDAVVKERRELLLAAGERFLESRVLRIVGPTFSGTAHSLKAAILARAWELGAQTKVEICSGAATSEEVKVRLEEKTSTNSVCFTSALHTDKTLLSVLEKHVLSRLNVDVDQVAILQESSTEYGQSLVEEDGEHSFLYLPFPMSIESLRRSYARDSYDDQAALPGRAKRTQVDLDLSGSFPPVEVPGLASELTPPTVALLLDEITRALGQRRIRVVVLFATDVRDKLFLGAELKRRLPDLQLVTTESNVLYLEPKLNRYLRGMIVLSTYPLLLRDPSWVPQSWKREQMMFSSEGAEGTFNASLFQLRELLGYDPSQSVLSDYWSIHRGSGRPPVWGTVVGAGTMLPLFVRSPEQLMCDRDEPLLVDVPRHDEAEPPPLDSEERSPSVLLSLFLLGYLTLLAAFARCVPSNRGKWTTGLETLHERYGLCLLGAATAAVWPMFAALIQASSSTLENWILLGCVAGLFAFVLVHGSRRAQAAWSPDQSQRFGSVEPRERSAFYWFLVLAALFLVASAVVSLAIFQLRSGAETVATFLHRAAEVEQGVTPLMPILLVGLSLAVLYRWLQHRVRFLADRGAFDRVLDHPSQALSEGERLPKAHAEFQERLHRLLPGRGLTIVFGLAVFLAAFRFGRTLEALVGFELEFPFRCLLFAGILGGMVGIAWTLLRVLSIWSAYRDLLHRLEGFVLTLPLAALSKTLRVTVNLSLWQSWHGSELDSLAREKWRELLVSRPGMDSRVAAHHREDLPAVADVLQALLLEPRQVPAPEGDKGDKGEKLEHQILALEFLIFVEWVLRHVRQLCAFLLLNSLLLLALVGSYPFHPQSEFQWLAFVLFGGVLLAIGYLIFATNRNATLSRLAGTTPGALTFDRTLITNIALFVVVPLTAVIGTQGGWIKSFVEKALPLLISG